MRSIIVIYIFIYSLCVFSQQKLPKKGVVSYGQLESLGMGGPVGIDFNSVLVFNNSRSIYITRSDSLEKSHINENVAIESEGMGFFISKVTNAYGFRYFKDLKKDSVFSRDIGFNYVAEKIPEIEWKIQNEKKKIGSYICTKATATFRGRDFVAWFTTEIPLPFGPWKLHGLPGLILEAHDPKKEIYFYFKNIKYPSETKIGISKPVVQKEQSWKKWITFDAYKIFLIEAYINAKLSGRMIAEEVNASNLSKEVYHYNMGNTYIENFDLNGYLKKQ
ncbi:MAG: GLPGLI family protein [Flavobacteriales bacterium CG_4_9_14_3_um_filter_40_17]|nr:MAG: GLPGLI family protein [Flavobacteriales bacterium CG_4_9_14_3_um_filter_40_17]